MRSAAAMRSTLLLLSAAAVALGVPAQPQTPFAQAASTNHSSISDRLFVELEELARVVDIAYCVGTAGLGIQKPFQCASRCGEFENFELVTVGTSPAASAIAQVADTYLDLEHGASAVRLLWLYCAITSSLGSSHSSRLPWNLLHRQHHYRPLYNPSRVRAVSWRR